MWVLILRPTELNEYFIMEFPWAWQPTRNSGVKGSCILKEVRYAFLIETLVGVTTMESIKTQLGFEVMVVVENEGHRGGLALLWKTKNTVSLLSFSRNFIDMVVKFPNLPVWWMTGLYGCPERRRRKESWDILINVSTKSNLPWCIVGDFNDILMNSEKKGRVRHLPSLNAGF